MAAGKPPAVAAMNFKDHFSAHAAGYAGARPGYPDELFEWLALQCPRRRLAWDAGCGNGQASVALAGFFEEVYATGAAVFHVRQSRVTKFVINWERERALADLGLAE